MNSLKSAMATTNTHTYTLAYMHACLSVSLSVCMYMKGDKTN